MIILTQLDTHKKMVIDPTIFIVHQPRRLKLQLPGKRAFQTTTIMSVFTPEFCFRVEEPYEPVAEALINSHPGEFLEWTHGETGTKFCLCAQMFALFEPGCATGFPTSEGGMETTNRTSIVSVMNPAVWVPLKETFAEAKNKYNSVLLSWQIKSAAAAWGRKNDA